MSRPHSINDIELLRGIFLYLPRKGILRWRKRPATDFQDCRAQKSWNSRYAGETAGCVRNGYLRVHLRGKTILVHRICFALGTGIPVPDGITVDHKDGDTLNNKLCNLRSASHAQNLWNSRTFRNKKSKLPKNVTLYKPTGRYIAAFQANKKKIYLGYFDTPELASAALKKARKFHHGEFARHK